MNSLAKLSKLQIKFVEFLSNKYQHRSYHTLFLNVSHKLPSRILGCNIIFMYYPNVIH